MTTQLWNAALRLKIWKDTRGQDLLEFVLLAGLISTAGAALLPGIGSSIVSVLSKVALELQAIGGGGGAPTN